ncbi:MAG: sulfate adenylyltransferase, partial [Simkaniaceae bacterium]|nr:sulfate adenylyltransferase [Simkaniaceae bacterium]
MKKILSIFLLPLLLFAKPLDEAYNYPALHLNARQKCDLELLLNGGFAPLKGFLCRDDYRSVVEKCRLADGTLWPMPINLAIDDRDLEKYKGTKKITLMDELGNPLALLSVEEIYKPDLIEECKGVFGTTDTNHPYVNILLSNPNVHYVGGTLEKIALPLHFDFNDLRMTPDETKAFFEKNDWNTVVGFQSRNPLHKSHLHLTKYCAKQAGDDAKILIQPVVGITQANDVDYHTRVRCYKKLLKYYPEGSVKLALLPLSMRMGGPREALWHALIRQNYGCTHFIVGRDHAGPSTKTKEGNSFYGPYDAHKLIESVQSELKIQILKSKEIVYVEEIDDYLPVDEVPKGLNILRISGTAFRRESGWNPCDPP